MIMKNDGQWCWVNSTYTRNNIHMSGHDVTLSQSNTPKHGQVLIGDMPNFGVRVAYKPASGFVGTDNFTVHYGIIDCDLTFAVTVSQ